MYMYTLTRQNFDASFRSFMNKTTALKVCLSVNRTLADMCKSCFALILNHILIGSQK